MLSAGCSPPSILTKFELYGIDPLVLVNGLITSMQMWPFPQVTTSHILASTVSPDSNGTS